MKSPLHMRIISDQAGLGALPLRAVLRVFSWLYGGVIRGRNHFYDKVAFPKWLDVPVISVGNLTVGGTGKTPMTLWLCRYLLSLDLKPAVLSRGYRASAEGMPDEIVMLSRQCPEAVAIAHPDRYAAGCLAVEEYGVQAAVLDDGFQHRRVGRDIDIVLIDATRPFGFGYILPRGLLREPLKGLRRAEAVVITRCDQVEPERVDQIEARVRELNPKLVVVRAEHRPVGLCDLSGKPRNLTQGSSVGCFAGIARPEAFARTLADMNMEPAALRCYPDHHVYTAADVADLCTWADDNGVQTLVTTEKDAVKLAEIEADWSVELVVLRVEIVLRDDGEQLLAGLISEMLNNHAEADEAYEKAAALLGTDDADEEADTAELA